MGQNTSFREFREEPGSRDSDSTRVASMNILFVQPALPHYRLPFFTELQRHASNGARNRVHVWCDFHNPSLPHCDSTGLFHSEHHPETTVGPLLWRPAITDAIRDPWADVVVLTWNIRYVQLLPALLEARARRRPVVLWGHGYSKHFSRWRHVTRTRLGKLASTCVTYSEGVRQRLIAEGLDATRLFSAPNALDGTPLRTLRQHWLKHTVELGELRQRLGIQSGRILLFVSRLEPDKRVDLLLTAFRRVLSRHSDTRLVIVGGGSELPRLKAEAQRLGVAQQTHFLGPIYDEHTLSGLFMSATAFVYPVAVGLSILHALHYGVPVVTSNNADCHNPEFDVLVHERNSLLYRHDDAADLTDCIARILEQPGLCSRLAEGALQSVSAPHGRTLAAMAEGMLAAVTEAWRFTRSR